MEAADSLQRRLRQECFKFQEAMVWFRVGPLTDASNPRPEAADVEVFVEGPTLHAKP